MATVKIFTPDDWVGIDPMQHQVKVAAQGLGPSDAKAAEKFMSPETAHFFRRMELNPDCFYVHKIAMGDSDHYGPNRWGDGFSAKALKNDVHTFEKHAKAYRQHKSKGDHYGHVKIARYREDDGIVELITEYYGTPKVAAANGGKVADEEIGMLTKQGYIPVSMGSLVPFDTCFREDRLVYTVDGYRRIADVKIGDMVYSHTGQLRHVTGTLKRRHRGSMVTLSFHGYKRGIESTAEHPYLVLRRDTVRQPAGRRRNNLRDARPSWLAAEDIDVGDFLLQPVIDEGVETVERVELAYIYGAFCGDGCRIIQRAWRNKRGPHKLMGLGFACDMWLPDNIEKLEDLLNSYCKNSPRRYADEDRNYVSIRVYDQEFASDVVAKCGDLCLNKIVPDYLFTASIAERLSFLAGMLDTDGSVDHKKLTGRLIGANEQLIRGCYLLALSCGLPCTFGWHETSGGFSVDASTAFVVYLCKESLHKLSEYAVKAADMPEYSGGSSQFKFSFDGVHYQAVQVTAVANDRDDTAVYNISVDVDESYIVEGVAVHNCSICSHDAPKPKDRCLSKKEGGLCSLYGCTNGMLKVAADGRLQYVDNPYNTFYDISMVKVGADPIANGVLLPVGEYYANLSSNSKTAEFAFAQLPETIDDNPVARSIHQAFNKLASLEYAHSVAGEEASYADAGFCKLASVSSTMTGQMLRGYSQQQTAFGQAATRREFLSFRTLCKEAGMPDCEVDAAARFLPDLYQRIKLAGLGTYVVNTAAKLASVCQGYKSKFFATKSAGLLLPEITRASLTSAARGEVLTPISPADHRAALPDVVVKYAAFELCLSHLADDSDLRLLGLVRRKLYLL